jgi:hypothetical protein
MGKATRTGKRQKSPAVVANGLAIVIRAKIADQLFEAKVTNFGKFARIAHQWSYILRARARWASHPDRREDISQDAADDLGTLGISVEQIRHFASASRVEVEFSGDFAAGDRSRAYEAASSIPWEFLISAATLSEGRFRPLLVTRLLRNGMSAVTAHPPESVLFVESAPGRLNDIYGFDDEEERIRAAVGVDSSPIKSPRWGTLKTPSLSALREAIHKRNWEAVHVTGVDTQQVSSCIDDFYPDLEQKSPKIYKSLIDQNDRLTDGMILWEETESELPVPYTELADVLVRPSSPARIFTLNLYFSGARIARELIRRGAHVALGFLDEVDDEVAENFFQNFYWAWCHPDDTILSIPDAFFKAWESVREKELHGTSIVIWMGRSVFDPGSDSRRRPVSKKRAKKRATR